MQVISGRKPKGHDFLPLQIVIPDDQERRGMHPQDMALARDIARVLMEHYPGHNWWIQVDSKHGVAVIRHPFLTGPHMGYVIHLTNLKNDPKRSRAIKGAGEILERWNVSRGGMRIEEIVAAELSFNDKKIPGMQKRPGLIY